MKTMRPDGWWVEEGSSPPRMIYVLGGSVVGHVQRVSVDSLEFFWALGAQKGTCAGLDEARRMVNTKLREQLLTKDSPWDWLAADNRCWVLTRGDQVVGKVLHKPSPFNVDIYVIPWYGEEITINFSDRASIQAAVDIINEVIQTVEKEDPWVKKVFDADGIGEGVVYYPITPNVHAGFEDRGKITGPMFKAKGEAHKTNATKKKQAVQIDPDVLASIEEFVAAFVTEARCEQGVAEACGGEAEMKLTGKFLGWMGKDVEKESKAELEVSGLTWKQVDKAVNAAAREWFITKAKAI